MSGRVVTTEEVVDELLRPLREQMLSMASYGDSMRESRDRLEAERDKYAAVVEIAKTADALIASLIQERPVEAWVRVFHEKMRTALSALEEEKWGP